MMRRPKPIPMLGDARANPCECGPTKANPPDDFTATVIANHIRTATVEAKRAHHYESFSAGSRRPSDWQEPAIRHAAKAGEYAAYSGRSLEQWHADLGAVLANPVISAAFDANFRSTILLLSTPDNELEDATPNPARRWTSSEVQSLLFDAERWDLAAAKQWAKDHKFKYGNTDTTDGYHHLRQFDPVRGRPCRTITMVHDQGGIVKPILARVCSQ